MKELICIVCPRGCHLEVTQDENTKEITVKGNSCNRGHDYGINELTHPTRMITSTVAIESTELKRLPVMTDSPIPKEKVFAVMEEINKTRVKAPIMINDVIIRNVLNLNVNIVATRNILK